MGRLRPVDCWSGLQGFSASSSFHQVNQLPFSDRGLPTLSSQSRGIRASSRQSAKRRIGTIVLSLGQSRGPTHSWTRRTASDYTRSPDFAPGRADCDSRCIGSGLRHIGGRPGSLLLRELFGTFVKELGAFQGAEEIGPSLEFAVRDDRLKRQAAPTNRIGDLHRQPAPPCSHQTQAQP